MQDERTELPEVSAEENEPIAAEAAEENAAVAAEEAPAEESTASAEAERLLSHLAELETALQEERRMRRRREMEDAGRRALTAHSLDAALLPLLLGAEETASEEALYSRASALASAIESAARQMLVRRAAAPAPVRGSETPLSGAMIREMPLSQLAELIGGASHGK